MSTYFIIATVILALAPAIAGLWWWRKGAGIQILLFALFVSIASLAMLPVMKTMPEGVFYALDMTDSFTTLLILPLLFNVLTRITKYRCSKKVYTLWFLPPLLAGAMNALMHIMAVFSTEGVTRIREIGLAEGAGNLIPENFPQMLIFVNYDIYNAILFLQVIAFVYMLIRILRRYNNSIESYYVDLQFTDCRYVRNIANTMMVAIIVFYIVLIMQRDTANEYPIILLLYLIVSFIVIWVIGWNLAKMEGDTVVLYLQESNFSNEEIADLALNKEIDLTSGVYPEPVVPSSARLSTHGAQEGSTTCPEPVVPALPLEACEEGNSAGQSQYIEDEIKKWVNSSTHPYLKEGITINDVADEMGISSRILSAHLNHAMHQNFNSWINNLRIEEAKTMFREDTGLSGNYVAIKCGFADAAMLSKNFKRVTGMTITEFKKQ